MIFQDISIFFSGSIKIFGGLIWAQCFYNLLKTDVFSPSSVIKSEAMREAGMPRVLWLISSWQRPYFFPSETLIFLWPCLGKKRKKKLLLFLEPCYFWLLIKYHQSDIIQNRYLCPRCDLAPHKRKRSEMGFCSSWLLTLSDCSVVVVGSSFLFKRQGHRESLVWVVEILKEKQAFLG